MDFDFQIFVYLDFILIIKNNFVYKKSKKCFIWADHCVYACSSKNENEILPPRLTYRDHGLEGRAL